MYAYNVDPASGDSRRGTVRIPLNCAAFGRDPMAGWKVDFLPHAIRQECVKQQYTREELKDNQEVPELRSLCGDVWLHTSGGDSFLKFEIWVELFQAATVEAIAMRIIPKLNDELAKAYKLSAILQALKSFDSRGAVNE